MRHRLVAAALITLFGTIGQLTPLVAQPVTSERHQRDVLRREQSIDPAPKGERVERGGGKRHVRKVPLNQREIAEARGYKSVSSLVNFPKFFPGLGIIYVKPDTLPIGPFLCFDRRDHLVATVYMIPIKDIDDRKSFDAPGFAGRVDHVSIYFNSGHPGVDVPHYHVVIWHVTKEEEARVAR